DGNADGDKSEFRLKREADVKAYEVKQQKELTLMQCKELEFLTLKTDDYGVASDDYEGAPVFDDDYKEAPVFNDDQFEEEKINVRFMIPILKMSLRRKKGICWERRRIVRKKENIEDVLSLGILKKGFVGEGGFGEEEEKIEDVVVVANDLCSSMIQPTLSVDFSKTIDSNPHELIWSQKGNLVDVSILIGKKYQEGYLKAKPMDDTLGFKTIKV
ncbi:hypothetical protein Tco_1336334, partial [Tanacetum coccineum]